MKKALLSISFLLCLYLSYSQPGELDRSFGGQGMVITDMGASAGLNTIPSKGILLQPDGSMFMAVTANQRTSVSKYRANGTTYLAYGTAGFSASVAMNAVQSAQQADGKIIVVGTTFTPYVGAQDLVIARFKTDGSLDSSFGGKAFLTFHFDEVTAGGVAIQKNGKNCICWHINR